MHACSWACACLHLGMRTPLVEHVHAFSWTHVPSVIFVHIFSCACICILSVVYVHAFSWACARFQLCMSMLSVEHASLQLSIHILQLNLCIVAAEHVWACSCACACLQLSICTLAIEHVHAFIWLYACLLLSMCMFLVEQVHACTWECGFSQLSMHA